MKNNDKVTTHFSLVAICYIAITFIVKSAELFLLYFSKVTIDNFSGFIYGNLISALFISCCLFVIYFIIGLKSKKIALYTVSTLFSLMTIAEIGLIIYHKSTGLLMGSELINRPLWETILTIRSITNIWMFLLTLFIIALITFLFVCISKKRIHILCSKIIFALMIISVPLTFILKPNQDKNIVNKIWYCIYSIFIENNNNPDSNNYHHIPSQHDSIYIDEYKKLYPWREVINDSYPLERNDNIGNVLGSFFKQTDKKPNIVFIVVESLGSDFFGLNGYTMTPFLDSLSRHSLLWTNCLSTTPRSAGVIPAITGSVPHGSNGFQFGNIPDCNSLIPILKENGYKSNVFYACSFNFDRIGDYLLSQGIDYMSPFDSECRKSKDKTKFDYTNWGYHDMKMFERSTQVISERRDNSPNLDIFITISQHDNILSLNNKELENYYYNKAETLLQSMPDNQYNLLKGKKGFIATFLYGDDATRNFIDSYTRRYENTIFIITGDHSLNNKSNNPLNAFHVPLIIWSPLIDTPQHFHSVVSHNDIAPSLTALLRDNFKFTTPRYINWVSDGLDTSVIFRSNVKTHFMMQNNNYTNIVFNDMYYIESNGRRNLFRIKENLDVEAVDDKELYDIMKSRMDVALYIDNYTYSNNQITNNPIIPKQSYELIKSIDIDSVFCTSGKEKPSVAGVESVDIFSGKTNSGYSKIKIVMTADMKYTANIAHQDFINISAKCSFADWYPDHLSKYIVEKNHHPNEYIKLEFTKTFHLRNHRKKSKQTLFLTPSEHDHVWNPEHSVTLKNINIKIFGVKHNNL